MFAWAINFLFYNIMMNIVLTNFNKYKTYIKSLFTTVLSKY